MTGTAREFLIFLARNDMFGMSGPVQMVLGMVSTFFGGGLMVYFFIDRFPSRQKKIKKVQKNEGTTHRTSEEHQQTKLSLQLKEKENQELRKMILEKDDELSTKNSQIEEKKQELDSANTTNETIIREASQKEESNRASLESAERSIEHLKQQIEQVNQSRVSLEESIAKQKVEKNKLSDQLQRKEQTDQENLKSSLQIIKKQKEIVESIDRQINMNSSRDKTIELDGNVNHKAQGEDEINDISSAIVIIKMQAEKIHKLFTQLDRTINELKQANLNCPPLINHVSYGLSLFNAQNSKSGNDKSDYEIFKSALYNPQRHLIELLSDFFMRNIADISGNNKSYTEEEIKEFSMFVHSILDQEQSLSDENILRLKDENIKSNALGKIIEAFILKSKIKHAQMLSTDKEFDEKRNEEISKIGTKAYKSLVVAAIEHRFIPNRTSPVHSPSHRGKKHG